MVGNSQWYTQARVDEIVAEKDAEIRRLQHHLDQTLHTLTYRTRAMHRVLKKREPDARISVKPYPDSAS